VAAAGCGVTVSAGVPFRILHCALHAGLRRWFAAVLAVAACSAHGETQVRVMQTDPPAQAELGRDQPFYVRIAFSTDTPLSIWARPYFNGKPVIKIKSNAALRRNGSGEALGWFSLDARDEVDEVRIIVGGGDPWREWSAASYPVRLVGTGAPAAPQQLPQWVAELRQLEQQLHAQEMEKRRNEPEPPGTALWLSGFMLAVLCLLTAALAWPAWALWRWRDGWRLAAAIPLLMMLVVVLRILIDTTRDPTSHNLWPLEILMFGTGSIAIMGVLAVIRRFSRGRQ
jgi:hypothetical protein